VRSSLAAGLLLAFLAASVTAQEPPSTEYRMKSDDSRTGTRLKHDIATSTIPFEKTWAQLSEAERNSVRSAYVSMGPNDEPPYPARGYARLSRVMAEVQSKLYLEGMLDIGVMVGSDGRATEVKVYGSPDERLTRIAAAALMSEKYKPAQCNGAPCAQEFPFQFQFTLTH
jgi:hypothetical protein